MIALRQETSGNYSRMMTVSALNVETLNRARHVFDNYKSRGIILNSSFDDDVWNISDEKRTTKLMSFGLQQTIPLWVDCSGEEYCSCLKMYIAFNLGELAPYTLQDMSRELARFSAADIAETKYPNHVAEFLKLLPGGSAERDWIIEQLSERKPKDWYGGKGQQRVLADFQSYLRFGDTLTNFWHCADKKRKLFYFPLYFWWNLTAILPLRVTEFLLTPRNCLNVYDGKYSITVRRSKLKGGGRKIAYKIAEDYSLHTYEITNLLGEEVRNYISVTKDMPSTQLDTLFLVEPHCKYLSDGIVHKNHKYYTYQDLSDCIRTFYDEVIAPSGVEISSIKLGDTRHLAMVNLVISGGSPTICRELAGHTDINISSHYYTNISNLIVCATTERLQKQKDGSEASITGKPKYSLTKPNFSQRVTGGFCESESFANHDIGECLKAVGADGKIGECIVCQYFRPDKQGVQVNIGKKKSAAKAKVDEDSKYLMQTIELVRRGLGYQEDIGAALLRLQHSGNRYSTIIQEKYDYGKT